MHHRQHFPYFVDVVADDDMPISTALSADIVGQGMDNTTAMPYVIRTVYGPLPYQYHDWENYLPKSNDSKVLIVDDICDSGETFERLSNYIKDNINHECDVRFSALWWNNECDFEPHYYTRDLAKDSEPVWIFFPHENWWEGSIS